MNPMEDFINGVSDCGADKVNFEVGPQHEVIVTSRSLLCYASETLANLFDDIWDHLRSQGHNIIVPLYDPRAFKFFIKALEVYNLTEIDIQSWNESANLIFCLSKIVKDYNVKRVKIPLQVVIDNFMSRQFADFVETQEFASLSPTAMEQILGQDYPLSPLQLFHKIIMWASLQCKTQGISPYKENIRMQTESFFNKIPFTSMAPQDFFSGTLPPQWFLSKEELAVIFKFLNLSENRRHAFNPTGFPFALPKRRQE